jgi:hypothetical protein
MADEPKPLTDEDLVRATSEWRAALNHPQRGVPQAIAESEWAIDWAERLLAEVRRFRAEP